MAHLLGAEELHLEYPTRVVFDSITLGVEEGDRIGIVGRNGDGKSSLLRMLAGSQQPDSGKVTIRGGVRIGLLSQDDQLDDESTVGHSIVGDRPDYEWASDPRIRDVLHGLVADLAWDATIGALSGGQRRRVALAALLVGDWDVLCLDEPTNHLDVEGITWLAGHLKNRWGRTSGGLLVVTHDRWFLDEVCLKTWEVHDRLVEPFEGGYAAYILQRVERDRQAAVTEQKRQNLLRKELAWLGRGAPARSSKPRFHIETARELIADVPPLRDRVQLSRLAVSRLGKQVVDLEDAGVAFDGKSVLHDVTWRISPGERTAILGANGAGKSTLLALIAGTLPPTSGHVRRGKTVKLAELDQRFRILDDIASDRVREVLARYREGYAVEGRELSPAELLERLGFSSAHLSARVSDLSGGQRRRLQLLLTLLDEPNVLLLDEPTNDVDTDMLTAMEDLLDSWPGTLIVVSHDRYFVERVTDQQYALLEGRLRHLPGGVDEYVRLQEQRERQDAERKQDGSAARGGGRATASSPVGESALSGSELRAAQKELAAVERKLARLDEQIAQVKILLDDQDPTDYEGLQNLAERLEELGSEKSSLEDRWLVLSEATDL